MAYNPALDETIWSKEVDISNPFNRGTKFKFIVSIMRYKDGEQKLDVKRLVYGAGRSGEYHKMGRLTKDELADLIPVFLEAVEKMNK